MIIRIRTSNVSNARTMEVDVPDNIALEITQSYRDEDNCDFRSRYHNYSLDAVDYEGEEYASDVASPEVIMEEKHEASRIENAMSHLTETQRRRIQMYADGMSEREIAKAEGTSQKSIHECLEGARKKFLKYF